MPIRPGFPRLTAHAGILRQHACKLIPSFGIGRSSAHGARTRPPLSYLPNDSLLSSPLGETMKVAIGVPTYNRRHLVELNAASLCSSSIPPGTALIVVDDVSTAYDVEFLRSIYPKFADIRRRSESSGDSSFASRDVMRQLLETDADALLLLDWDFLVSSNFLAAGVALLPKTDGVLSLFNTPNHPVIGSRGPVVLKQSIGCAGSLWRRDIAARVFNEVPGGPRWDWRFSNFLVEAKIAICVVRDFLSSTPAIQLVKTAILTPATSASDFQTRTRRMPTDLPS